MVQPVFFDPSGRRGRWSKRAVAALAAIIFLAVGILVFTVVDVPIPPPLKLGEVTRFIKMQERPARHFATRIASWLPKGSSDNNHQLRVGFYVPWDDASRISLSRHAVDLDWVVPAIASVVGQDHRLVTVNDPRFTALMAKAGHLPKEMTMVQNAQNGSWDSAGMAQVLASAPLRAKLLDEVQALILARHSAGVVFDFEELPTAVLPAYQRFVAEARTRFSPKGWQVTLAVPVGNPDWNLPAFARAADKLFVMDYDEHDNGSEPGPIASQGWFVRQLESAVRQIGPDKAIVAIGAYGYDWVDGGEGSPTSIEEAWLAAHDSEQAVHFDPVSGNSHFDYDEEGTIHHVWLLDAASGWNQLRAADKANVAGVAIWRLGSEDPSLWNALASFETGKRPDLTSLQSVGDVDVEGNGEILHIDDTPTTGHRIVSFDRAGLIEAETFQSLPTPFVVRRTGAQPKQVALTFDDGPDADWTPRILDILKQKQAPGSFFVVGENAVLHPGLLRRIVDEGSELGNHSYTHPNLAQDGPEQTRLELNATQRLVEAYTGRAMRMFRAPYFGDAEPTTADELFPALAAQQDGYANIGLHVDPGDWKRPGVDTIVRQTLEQVAAGNAERSGNIVLLHDGGGDRSQTVAALPVLIDQLRARGYEIVPVSRLAGLAPAAVMPQVTGRDLLAVRTDVGIFLVIAAAQYMLKWLFMIAIALGILRAVTLAFLAWGSTRKSVSPLAPVIDPNQFVSVIIPAYNEAQVIEASIARVLASTNVRLEVIVADDGSSDGTGMIVQRAFGLDSRVRLLSLVNGGKAAALNRAMALARGEIIIALDADTQFEPETVARLARWFVNPELGAVAGNAMVGNRVNLVTRWQAVEYVTAQNLERRALARFNAITVVPGAVGAWRRSALESVGFYPEDTLAEDQDLTIAIQRKGWRVTYDCDAVAWTESPDSFRALAKQRFRWAFGTLQCLWKHRAITRDGEPRGLALVGIPQAWLFQIGFALISPVIDLALVVSIVGTGVRVMDHGWAQTRGDVGMMALFWLGFTGIDAVCGWIAYRLGPLEKRFPLFLLVAQRFVYRQLMYSVVIRAVATALRGPRVGWGKLERSGVMTAPISTDLPAPA